VKIVAFPYARIDLGHLATSEMTYLCTKWSIKTCTYEVVGACKVCWSIQELKVQDLRM